MIWFLVAALAICLGVIVYLIIMLDERNIYIKFLWHQINELSSGDPDERLNEYIAFLRQQRESVAKFQADNEPYIHNIE